VIRFADDELPHHCETCAYWETHPWWKTGEIFHMCCQPRLCSQYSPGGDHLAPNAVVIVNREGEGMLCTGPKFGCCHWAAKEEDA
jgi:hypothetical protein